MDKKSFILYGDYEEHFNLLSDKDKGKLIMIIFDYTKEFKTPKIDNPVINMAFSFIKAQLDRDHGKYLNICKRNQENGLHGGRPKNPEKPKKPNGISGNPEKPKKPDTDTDTENDTENEIDNENDIDIEKKVKKENIYRKFAHLKLHKTEFEHLLDIGIPKAEIDILCDEIENYKNNKNYKSLNLTIQSWWRKRKKQQIYENTDKFSAVGQETYRNGRIVLAMLEEEEREKKRNGA